MNRAPVRRPLGSACAVIAGLAVLLLTWILVIPPFGGSDEFDHAYRAAAAARGEWITTPSDATQGTGAWVDVPRDVVDAARAECQARVYTTNADCVGSAHGDRVRIASAAGRYQPLFYVLVGSASLVFHGTAALYAMRLMTATLALAFVVLSLLALGTWARSRMAYLVPAVVCTPVVVYSSAIVAPNGVEITAALAFWIASVGVMVADRAHLRRLMVVTAAAGTTLCVLRPLGPLWCLLSAVAVLVAVRPLPGRLRLLRDRRDALAAASVVMVGAVLSTIWTVTMKALEVRQNGDPVVTSLAHRIGEVGMLVPVWVLQSVAAFPMREDATHPIVYLGYLTVFGVIVGTALRVGARRLRIALTGVAVVVLAAPFVETVAAYDSTGAAWQGRYGLPLALGLVVLAGYALDRSAKVVSASALAVIGVSYVVAQVISVTYTLHVELGRSPLVDSSAWLRMPMWLTTVLAAIGAMLLWWGGVTSSGLRAAADEAPPNARGAAESRAANLRVGE